MYTWALPLLNTVQLHLRPIINQTPESVEDNKDYVGHNLLSEAIMTFQTLAF